MRWRKSGGSGNARFSGEEAASAGEEVESIELAAVPAEESSLDFDFNLDQEETPAPAKVKGVAAPDLDLSDISLDMGEPGSAKEAPTDLPDDFGSQEVSTKLDLARAYIDMGDVEGARDILQEVLKEGTAEQQKKHGSCSLNWGDLGLPHPNPLPHAGEGQ